MPKASLGVVRAYQEGSKEDRQRIVDGLPYETGALKPPVGHRFQKGNKSGRGRPRGRKNLNTQMLNAMALQVAIKQDGRVKKVDASEASLYQLAAKAAQGDLKATALLFDFARKAGLMADEVVGVSEPMLTEEDVGVWKQLSTVMSECSPAVDDEREDKKK